MGRSFQVFLGIGSILFGLAAQSAPAAVDSAFVSGIYSQPSIAGPPAALNPQSIKFVQWNVHMYDTAAEQRWNCGVARGEALDLCYAFRDADIAMIQEATFSNSVRDRSDAYLGLGDKHLVFAQYGVNKGNAQDNYHVSIGEKLERGLVVRDPAHNGSATFSRAAPLTSIVKLSHNSDNFWPYFMPVLATTYALAGRSDRLLVVHIHNLAGTGSDRQLELLDEAEQMIAAHRGPVVFAGDFNSATREKNENLYRLAARQGLAEVRYQSPFPSPFGPRQLDHTYVRGLNLVGDSVRVFGDSNRYSDHLAIAFELAVH